METHITGILYYNEEKGEWRNTCLPIKIEGSIVRAKLKTDSRALDFGLTPTSKWHKKENVHHRDFHNEFGELRRAFAITLKKEKTHHANRR